MHKRLFISLILLCSLYLQSTVISVVAQVNKSTMAASTTPFDRARYKIHYQKYVLDNGLTLLVHTDHSVPIVAGNTFGITLAHVMRNAARRGSLICSNISFLTALRTIPTVFARQWTTSGANNRNGTTNTDRTNFFEDVPVSALEPHAVSRG